MKQIENFLVILILIYIQISFLKITANFNSKVDKYIQKIESKYEK